LQGSLFKSRYLQECRKYCPELTLQDLQPYPAGIRAQVVLAYGTLVHDFLFADTARQVHVLNAPSPAATAAMPIAQLIAERAHVEG
jgi:L-2-hydroxyglutarate oxidase